jgi:hypothetical protein
MVDNSQLQEFPSAMDEGIEDPCATVIEENHEVDDQAQQVDELDDHAQQVCSDAPIQLLYWPHSLSIHYV